MDRRHASALLGLGFAGLLAPVRASQGAYPSGPVTVIVPYPAGGPSDTGARRISRPLGQRLGQPVVVDNISGVSGGIGAQKLLRAKADGHTVMFGSSNETILTPLVNPALQYRSEDFRLAALCTTTAYVLVGRKGLAADTLAELMKLSAAAGRPLSFGSVGMGSQQHLVGEIIKEKSGMNMMHVPYKGAAPVLSDLLGGQIDLAVMTFSGGTLEMIRTGKLKSFGVLSAQREPLAQELATIHEGGPLKDLAFHSWGGIFVPAKTPDDVVRKINAAVIAANELPEVRESAAAAGSQVAEKLTPEECARFYQKEVARFQAIAKTVNLSS